MSGDVYGARIKTKVLVLTVVCALVVILSICSWVFADFDIFRYTRVRTILNSIMYLPLLLIILYVFAREKYTLSVNSLLVGGAFGHKEEIYYSSITQVERIYNGRKGPPSAKNIKWIQISHGKDESTNVAPVRMEEFLSKLESRIPSRQKYEEE